MSCFVVTFSITKTTGPLRGQRSFAIEPSSSGISDSMLEVPFRILWRRVAPKRSQRLLDCLALARFQSRILDLIRFFFWLIWHPSPAHKTKVFVPFDVVFFRRCKHLTLLAGNRVYCSYYMPHRMKAHKRNLVLSVRGEIPKAFIVLREGYEPSKDLKKELQEFVKQRLAKHEYPRKIEFIDELPKTTTGKVKRRDLRKIEGITREQ